VEITIGVALTRILTIPLNLGIFSKVHDRFVLSQILKRFVSFAEFSFCLRGFPLSSLW
jgi:hypothetical protein